WPLALVYLRLPLAQEARQPCAVAARTFDREAAGAEVARPLPQPLVARTARLDLERADPLTEAIQRRRRVRPLMRVDTDRHRPLVHVASLSSNKDGSPGTELCRVNAQASLESPTSHDQRRETDPRKGISPAKPWVIPPPVRLSPPDQTAF